MKTMIATVVTVSYSSTDNIIICIMIAARTFLIFELSKSQLINAKYGRFCTESARSSQRLRGRRLSTALVNAYAVSSPLNVNQLCFNFMQNIICSVSCRIWVWQHKFMARVRARAFNQRLCMQHFVLYIPCRLRLLLSYSIQKQQTELMRLHSFCCWALVTWNGSLESLSQQTQTFVCAHIRNSRKNFFFFSREKKNF